MSEHPAAETWHGTLCTFENDSCAVQGSSACSCNMCVFVELAALYVPYRDICTVHACMPAPEALLTGLFPPRGGQDMGVGLSLHLWPSGSRDA